MALNPPLRDWHDKRVWLIGASTGIGEALAQRLGEAGARVALSSRNADTLRAVAARTPGSLVLPLDLTDLAALQDAHAQLLAAWGGLDMVIFNAGTYQAMRAWELTPGSARSTLALNLLGTLDGVATVLPPMLERGAGHLVLVASVAGYRGLPRALVYGPSKAALINFAESLYIDLAPRGIGVTVVNPGFVATPLTAGNDFRMPALITPREAAAHIVAGLARGRFEIHFPRRFTLVLKLLRCLPAALYFRLIRRATGC